MFRKTFAALGVAAIALLATPVAASAATTASCSGVSPDYVSAGVVTADTSTINPGDTVSVTWQDGYFAPGGSVSVGTSGPGAVGSQVAGSGVADANGEMTATVTAGADAAGSLVISGSSECATGGVTVTVVDSSAAAVASSSSSQSLAFTGSTVPVVLVLTGVGALAFGTILLVARSRTRRRMQL